MIALGGLVIACLPLNPRFEGSYPAEDDGFLRALKINSTISFAGKIKPSVPCCNILRHVKDPYEYERNTS
jgi:hypothetical protein